MGKNISEEIAYRIADKRVHHISVRLTDRELGLVEAVRKEFGFRSFSQAVRETICRGCSIVKDKDADSDTCK